MNEENPLLWQYGSITLRSNGRLEMHELDFVVKKLRERLNQALIFIENAHGLKAELMDLRFTFMNYPGKDQAELMQNVVKEIRSIDRDKKSESAKKEKLPITLEESIDLEAWIWEQIQDHDTGKQNLDAILDKITRFSKGEKVKSIMKDYPEADKSRPMPVKKQKRNDHEIKKDYLGFKSKSAAKEKEADKNA